MSKTATMPTRPMMKDTNLTRSGKMGHLIRDMGHMALLGYFVPRFPEEANNDEDVLFISCDGKSEYLVEKEHFAQNLKDYFWIKVEAQGQVRQISRGKGVLDVEECVPYCPIQDLVKKGLVVE